MTTLHRESRRDEDRLSAESYYDLLAALTLIKAQAQMVERWAHRNAAPDTDVALRRLQAIEHTVGRMVVALDAMPEAPGPAKDGDTPTNGSGPA